MRRSQFALGATLAVLAVSASAQTAARKPYIVQLLDAPVATYDGGVSGYNATRAAPGTRLDVTAANVQAYTTYLSQKQSSVIATVNPASVTYRYSTLLNGFAANLTDAELAKLVASSAVRSVTVDEPMPMDTSRTPAFLGLNAPGQGAWTRTDANGRVIKGEGVIIGHLDGGVWPENPSFSDKVDALGKPIASHLPGTVVYSALPPGRWAGICQPGEGFNATHCNNKLIGARYFNTIWKSAVAQGVVRTWSRDYLDSPRDADGHGTHTLSTAGGNEGVVATVFGSPFTISGIAPRARVASYKVCYVSASATDVPAQGSCFQGDSVAAAEAAVNDGVDVINFSVGGSRTSFNDAVSTAFANATFAGVFVSTSAGNSNVFPGNATTVAHVGPWTMTVGNSTHDRYTEAMVTLGAGSTVQGASFQTVGLPTAPLVWARDAGAGGATNPAAAGTNLAQCLGAADGVAPLLSSALVTGKILVCDRGANVLVNKVTNAKAAGALGVIILNRPQEGAVLASSNTTPLIAAVLPTVHVAVSGFAAVTTEARLAAGTAAFSASFLAPTVAPVMSDSSSRGPNQTDANLLKPEITGPGTDIIAAYTNTDITPAQRLQIIAGTLVPGPGANMISGTSMSSPHVAGAAALLKQANPTWSPYAIKSALMTSAQQTVKLANGNVDANRWGFGAGHLNPNGALDTQVVYDQTIGDHVNYFNRVINGRQLNIASLTHANVVGTGTLTRTLSNKGSTSVTYAASASLPGFTVTVAPSTLTIPAGGSASYTVTMARTTAPIEVWSFGDVTWSGPGLPTVRSPLSAKPSSFVGLSTVSDTRAIGTKIYTVGFGYTGPLLTTAIGLVPATTFSGTIATNQRQCYPLTVPAGTKILRAQLFNADSEGGSASDLDLVVLRGTTTVGSSGGGDSNELVSLNNPTPATNYTVCVDGFAPVNGSAAYRVSTWMVGATGPGTLKAFGPSSVVTGGTASIGMSWNVPAGVRYLGLVEFRSAVGGATIGTTQAFIEAGPGVAGTTFAPVLRDKPVAID